MNTNTKIRLHSIDIQGIKNVEYGQVTFKDGNLVSTSGAGIIGVFGQNGSGKTALLDSVALLKQLMSGQQLDVSSVYLVNLTAKQAKIVYTFILIDPLHVSQLSYQVHLFREGAKRLVITKEELAIKHEESQSFSPLLSSEANHNHCRLSFREQEHTLPFKTSHFHSPLFSQEALSLYPDDLKQIMALLFHYAHDKILLVNHFSSREFRFKDEFPLVYYAALNGDKAMKMTLKYGKNRLNQQQLALLEKIVWKISTLLDRLVPGVNISLKTRALKHQLFDVELFSTRDKLILPLKHESVGVKKLVLVLGALISMYNADDVLVVIDEIDSGIFEYLLGEIFLVLKEEGRGQLLFTSHNLRPLEILNPYQVVFTTADKDKRYLTLTPRSPRLNLRDVYIRSIELGGFSQDVVVKTDPFEISRAFRLAGEDDES